MSGQPLVHHISAVDFLLPVALEQTCPWMDALQHISTATEYVDAGSPMTRFGNWLSRVIVAEHALVSLDLATLACPSVLP
jgi:hypothetical protein